MTRAMTIKAVKAAKEQNDYLTLGDIKDRTGYVMSTAKKCYDWLIKYGYVIEDDGITPRHADIEKCDRFLEFNNVK